MKNLIAALAALTAVALPLSAQTWSIGAGTGPFVFGDFVERRLRPATPGTPSGGGVTMVLSGATRAGLAVDVQHDFAPRWGVRLEGTFTHAPLSVKERGVNDEAPFDAGDLDVSTFILPVVFRVNPRGAFRVHLMAGPALAIYRVQGTPNVSGIALLDVTSSRWGAAAGGGVGWWMGDRFAVEGNISDVVTSSPFEREDFPDVPGFNIPRPHNVHTTIGVRWKL